MKYHGIPTTIHCDQAQAFKSKVFELYSKDKNIKLLLETLGDLRGTDMVERKIQTPKKH